MQQPNPQPEEDEELEFGPANDYIPPESNVVVEPNFAAGLEQNLDEIALAHQLRVEEQIRLENTALRREMEVLGVDSSSNGTILERGEDGMSVSASVQSFQIDERHHGRGNGANSDLQFLPEQQRNNQLDIMSQGPMRLSNRSSPVGKEGRSKSKKPKPQEETGRMTTRKLSRNADLNKKE